MDDLNFEFGDSDPEDAYDPEDVNVLWDNIEELVSEYEKIYAIKDERERLEAAKNLVAKLSELSR